MILKSGTVMIMPSVQKMQKTAKPRTPETQLREDGDTNPYDPHIDALCKDEIDLKEFEERCRATWIKGNGPPPEGRTLVVGFTKDPARLVVGHAETPKTIWTIQNFCLPVKL